MKRGSPDKPGEDILLSFDDKDEVLKIINEGGDIISYLTKENSVCPLLGSKILLTKELGRGRYGTVFQIDIPGSDISKYVAKRNKDAIEYIEYMGMRRLRPILKERYIPEEVFYQFNGVSNENELIYKVQEYSIHLVKMPNFLAQCKNNYICPPEYSEYIISLLIGNLKTEGISINFINTFRFSTCKKEHEVVQYTFMEKIDTTFGKIFGTICKTSENVPDKKEIIALFIQTIHAIATFQRKLRVVHGDLHQDNIFLDEITDISTWKGEKLLEADYFRYVVDSVEIFIPRSKYIIKIGDWGYGCKYKDDSTPEICNYKVEEEEYIARDVIPTYYEPAYDLVYCLTTFYDCLDDEFIMAVLVKIFGGEPLNKQIHKYTPSSRMYRPIVSLLHELTDARADELLKNKKLMGIYTERPPINSKIITLGEI